MIEQSQNILILKRFNGEERYYISKARLNCVEFGGLHNLTFNVKTVEPAFENTCPDTSTMNAKPNCDFTILFETMDWDKLIGQEFHIPEEYDDRIDDYVTRLYYFEHLDVVRTTIKVLNRNEDGQYRVQIKGYCCDINFYDGSKPEAEINIDAWFERIDS